jgi:hypothetical protein
MTTTTDASELMTLREVADVLHVSPVTAWRLARKGASAGRWRAGWRATLRIGLVMREACGFPSQRSRVRDPSSA